MAFKNKLELWAALYEEWDAMPAEFIAALVTSTPRRVAAVHTAKGSGIKK